MPTTADWKVVRVPADHPAWNAIDDDDWNGHTFGNWLRAYIKGATVVIWPPPDYGDRLGRFLAALMNAGADRIVRGASQPVSDDGGPIEENCNAGPMGPREFAKQVAALLDTDESVDDWEDRLQKIGDARTENEKLRIALAACANHAAGYQCVSGMCSTEFLLGVPEEVRLQIGARERDRDANKAALVRVEAERDDLLKKNHNIVRGSEENKDALRKERDEVRAEFSEAVQDIPVRGGETFGSAVRRVVAERDRFAEICHSVFQVITEGDCAEDFSADDLPTAARNLVAERDRGYEFLRRWQEFATEAMRSLGEVDENTLPDDTKTRDVLLELVELMGLSTPWPLAEVLTKLCDAADHLLKDHDCDAHGWELVGSARDAGRAIVQRLSERRTAT